MDLEVILFLTLYGAGAAYATYLFWKHNSALKFKSPFSKDSWDKLF